MSRKTMLLIGVLCLVPMIVGCPKKKPTTPEQIPVETTPVAPPPREVAPPVTPPPQDVEEDTLPSDLVELNKVLVERGLIGDVFFEFDKYDLAADSRDRLAKNAAFMRENPGYLFTIEGHCDERGTNDYNLALGQRRATAAKDYITSLGVSGDVLRTISYGEERPFCTQSTESCWHDNRRAHFVVTGKR